MNDPGRLGRNEQLRIPVRPNASFILNSIVCAKGHVHELSRPTPRTDVRQIADTDELERLRKTAAIDRKTWNIMKHFPVLNLYGVVKGSILWSEDKKEASKCFLYAGGGIAGLGVGFALSPAAVVAPTIGRAIWQVIGVGVTSQVIGSGGDLAIDYFTVPELRHASSCELEQHFYERVGKDIPFVGCVYSCAKAGIAFNVGHNEEGKRCLKNGAINLVISSLITGVVHLCNISRHNAAVAKCEAQTAPSGTNGTETATTPSSSPVTESTPSLDTTATGVVETSNSSLSAGVAETGTGTPSMVSASPATPAPSTQGRLVRLALKPMDLPKSTLFKAALANTVKSGSDLCQHCTDNDCLTFERSVPSREIFIQCLENSAIYSGEAGKQRGFLKFMIECLCLNYGEDCHGNQGETVLELAAKSGNIPLLQAVMAFSPKFVGDLSEEDEYELDELIGRMSDGTCVVPKYILQKIIHRARFPEHLAQFQCFTPFNVFQTEFIPAHRPNHFSGGIHANGLRILCMDGGGTRGLIALAILDQILSRTGRLARDCFEWFAGTSTGGIILLYLALGHTIQQCRALYFRLKDQVFKCTSTYNSAVLEKLLKETFTEHALMKDITGVKILITATTGCAHNLRVVTFTNTDEATKYTPIWQVARCTSAAPLFFEPFPTADGTLYYDGGLGANNPTWPLLNELRGVCLENATIVSIGCGRAPNNEPPLRITFENIADVPASTLNLVDLLLDGVTESDGLPVDSAITYCSRTKCYYYRLSPVLPKLCHLAETRDVILVNAIWHVKVFATQHKDTFKEISRRLTLSP